MDHRLSTTLHERRSRSVWPSGKFQLDKSAASKVELRKGLAICSGGEGRGEITPFTAARCKFPAIISKSLFVCAPLAAAGVAGGVFRSDCAKQMHFVALSR